MTPETQEQINATNLLRDAGQLVAKAEYIAVTQGAGADASATVAAMLVAALELATTELTPQGRARLFWSEQ